MVKAEPVSIPAIANEKVGETSCIQFMDNFTIFYFLPYSSTCYDMTQFKVCFIIQHKCGLGKNLSSIIMKVSVYSTRTAAAVTPTPPPPGEEVGPWDDFQALSGHKHFSEF